MDYSSFSRQMAAAFVMTMIQAGILGTIVLKMLLVYIFQLLYSYLVVWLINLKNLLCKILREILNYFNVQMFQHMVVVILILNCPIILSAFLLDMLKQ